MRYFVITGHKAVSTGDFKLDDIAGGAGRLDILCRCVNSAFFLSHNLRKDVEIYLVLEGGDDAPKTVIFKGEDLRYLNPDERSTASLIRNALLKPVSEGEEVKSSPGVYVTRLSFPEVLRRLSSGGSPRGAASCTSRRTAQTAGSTSSPRTRCSCWGTTTT